MQGERGWSNSSQGNNGNSEKLSHLDMDQKSSKITLEIQKPYEFFQSSLERGELFRYCKELAKYLEREGITNLVIVDRSARPLYIGLREYWKKQFSEKPFPHIYFINPKGFKAKDYHSRGKLVEFAAASLMTGESYEDTDDAKNEADIISEFKDFYSQLYEQKDKALLLFDTCIHSGSSLQDTVRILRKMDFQDVRIGVVTAVSNKSDTRADFEISNAHPEKGCYPFDEDRLVKKTFAHPYSIPTKDKEEQERSQGLRQEIKRIIAEKLEELI